MCVCCSLPSLGNSSMDYGVLQTWAQIPALSLTSHRALCKLFNYSEPEPLMCKLETVTLRVTTRCPREKCLAVRLAHSRCSVSLRFLLLPLCHCLALAGEARTAWTTDCLGSTSSSALERVPAMRPWSLSA